MYSVSSNATVPLLNDGILSFIDSTAPHIWLPLAVCQAFEQAFGVSFDSITELYLINDSLHETLLRQSPSSRFELGKTTSSGQAVEIDLPYASFDLTVSHPIVQNITRYFPIRRSANLSRRSTRPKILPPFRFPCCCAYAQIPGTWSLTTSVPSSPSPNACSTTTPNKTSSTSHLTATTNDHTTSSSLLPGTIAGIVTTVVIGILLLLAFTFFLIRKPRNNTTGNVDSLTEMPESTHYRAEADGRELPDRRARELPAGPPSPRVMPANQTSPHEMPSTERVNWHESPATKATRV